MLSSLFICFRQEQRRVEEDPNIMYSKIDKSKKRSVLIAYVNEFDDFPQNAYLNTKPLTRPELNFRLGYIGTFGETNIFFYEIVISLLCY